jgi:hypothetical protein
MATASRGATGTDVAGEGFGGDFCPVFGLNLHVHGWQVTNQPGIFPCTLMSVLSRIPFFLEVLQGLINSYRFRVGSVPKHG